jgi:hypothetical protein
VLVAGITATPVVSSPESAAIAFGARGDIWFQGSALAKPSRLTTDGREHPYTDPSFLGVSTIAFIRDGDLVRMPVGTRRVETVARGPVLAYAWNQQRNRLAVVVQPNGVGDHLLYLYRPPSRARTLIRRFAISTARRGDGNTAGPDAERSLAWSPTGSLLIVDTDIASRERPIHVLDLRGRDLIKPLVGTHGRWFRDSVIYRSLTLTRWKLTNVNDGTTSTLPIHHGRMHPALSPDGLLLAFDNGQAWIPGRTRHGCTCSIFVYDFQRQFERRVRAGVVAPLWLSPRTLAATEVRACSGGDCGVDVPMWVPAGSGLLVGLNGSSTKARGLSTLDAASRSG